MNALKIRIASHCYKESIEFYSNVIGLTCLQRWGSSDGDDQGCIFGFSDQSGQAFLELAPAGCKTPYAGLSLQFRVDSINQFVASLADSIDYRGPVTKPWGSQYLTMQDPSGVALIIFQGDL